MKRFSAALDFTDWRTVKSNHEMSEVIATTCNGPEAEGRVRGTLSVAVVVIRRHIRRGEGGRNHEARVS